MKLLFILTACLLTSATQGCTHIDINQVDVKKMTYKALRQQDCRMNEPNAFCERGFANEYEEYERMREQFIRDELLIDKHASASNLALPTITQAQ